MIKSKTILFLSVFLVSSSVFAQSESAETPFIPNINKGNFRIGGGFGFGYSTYSSFILNVSPTFQYFVTDRLAIGLEASYSASNTTNHSSIGPIVDWFFWNSGRWASFVELKALHTSGSNSISFWTTEAGLGLNYFIIPEIAFGPVLKQSYDHSPGNFYSTSTNLTGNFSIFF